MRVFQSVFAQGVNTKTTQYSDRWMCFTNVERETCVLSKTIFESNYWNFGQVIYCPVHQRLQDGYYLESLWLYPQHRHEKSHQCGGFIVIILAPSKNTVRLIWQQNKDFYTNQYTLHIYKERGVAWDLTRRWNRSFSIVPTQISTFFDTTHIQRVSF